MTVLTHAAMVETLKSADYEAIAQRMTASHKMIDIQHALMGIFSEGGELADAIKRHIFYGTELDVTNLKEESGDLLWYVQLLIKAMNWSMEEVMDVNEAKLRKRYGEKFTEHAAVHRDLDGERKVLENVIPEQNALTTYPEVMEIKLNDIDEDGFIQNTGTMPVEKGTLIDIMHKDRTYYYNQECGSLFCETWELRNTIGDIIKWRLAPIRRLLIEKSA